MTASSIDPCFTFTMHEEGDDDLSLDRADPGNWSSGEHGVGRFIGSKYGVSAESLIEWMAPALVTPATMANLSRDTARAIFEAQTWNVVRGDDLPTGVDLSVVDMGYNAGEPTSVRLLQKLVGVTADGLVGDQTLAALKASDLRPGIYSANLSATSVKALQTALGVVADGAIGPKTRVALMNDPHGPVLMLLAMLAEAQAAHYRALTQFSLYGTGWLGRTWRRASAAMALTKGG